MDCDIDWCLTCEKRVEGSSPYCSEECQNRAGPSLEPQFYYQQSEQYSSNYDDDDDDLDDDDVIFHSIDASSAQHSSRWLGNDQAGISAWAAEIPAGASAGDSSSPNDDSSSFHSPSTPHFRPPPPNLITPHRRAVPPSLSMTTPPSAPQPPSSPWSPPSASNRQPQSMGQTSLRTAATESSLATPASSHPVPIISTSRKPSMLEGMYSHVRSWVSPSPALVSTKQRTPLPVLSLDPPTKSTSQLTRSSNLLPVTVISSPHLSHGFPDQSAVCWMAGTVLIDQTAAKLPSFYEQPSRGRTLNSPSPFRHDDHPSFRTRGRKASRAAA
ncbi:hypothetical protein BDZ97DRAFT_1752500 [Flammula alnicola]|nr:hypothetical protein BDZ97DRAFT_1752500 [Flammula alnicola]